jgi:aryl-alcohol dehydrogenase-like predicted oxidoreductase
VTARIALGCGNFGGIGSAPAFWGRGQNEDEAWAIMDAAWAAGIRWFDTADGYGGGRSESFIGRWRDERRPDGLTVTTKVFHPLREGGDQGLAPDRIRRNVEGSLERLGVARIDYYLAHEPDPATPLAETVGAFEELVAEGVIGAWGMSNYGVDGISEALRHGRPALVQNGYSLLNRADDAGVLPLCAREGIRYVPFGPLEGGWLAGRYRRDSVFPEGSRMTMRPEPYEHLVAGSVFDALDSFEAAAAARHVDMATLAFAWVLTGPAVAGVVCGPSRPAHLEPALAALELPLAPGEREDIGSLFP